MQKLWHFVISLLISLITEDIYLKLGVCVHYPKSNPYYQGRQFKRLFFSEICPFLDLDFVSSIKHPTAERRCRHAVLFLDHLSTTCSGWAIVIDHCPASVCPCVCPSVCEQLLKKSSLKPANRFQWNFTEMILGWCTFRILQRYEFHEELWLPLQPKEKTLKIFLSQNVRARAFIFGM